MAQKTGTHTLKSRRTQNESPFFFENEQGGAVTVNSDRYRVMLNEVLFTCHLAEATLNVLRPVFEDRIISRRADVVWPPRSSNLTPLDYYFWGSVRDKCYSNKPEKFDALKDKSREVIAEIQLHTIDNVLKNWNEATAWPAEAAI